MIHRFLGAEAVVSALRPTDPLMLLKTHKAFEAARAAVETFPGTVAYAVKVCDRAEVIEAIADAGVSHFDVASIHEIRHVLALLPRATLHYMNPVKSIPHIAEAYALGVRSFAYDTVRELDKIIEATGGALDVVPVVRVGVPQDKAMFALDRKFGSSEEETVLLLRLAADRGYRPGVTFHVGSQCEDAEAFFIATDIACRAARTAGVEPSVVDIGGGFAVAYSGPVPSFTECVTAAKRALDAHFPNFGGIFQCEPGRLLAATSASALVRVELRKGQALYLNEGYYGLLSELKWMPALHPLRLIRPGAPSSAELEGFELFGPTCDSIDAMDGPYMLPADVDEGDWIEIDMIGAYSTVLASRFNGFPEPEVVLVHGRPSQRKMERAAA